MTECFGGEGEKEAIICRWPYICSWLKPQSLNPPPPPPPTPSLSSTDVHAFTFKQICPFCTSAITWRRQAREEEALNNLPWKAERGPLSSSIRLILELFQDNDGKSFVRQGRAHMSFAEHTDFILNWTDPSLLATPSSPIPVTYMYSCRLNVWYPISMCFLRSISVSRQIQAWKEKAGPGHFRKAGSEMHWERVEAITQRTQQHNGGLSSGQNLKTHSVTPLRQLFSS